MKGVYKDFHSAVAVLRTCNNLNQLDKTLQETEGSLDSFFDLLGVVENNLATKPVSRPFVVVVEGLDGSGKSTLVKSLAEQQYRVNGLVCNTHAIGCPTASISGVRAVFDKCSGLVPRAFYTVSNYILQYEMRIESEKDPLALFFVDRWYASTCGYSVGWDNTSGGPDAVDELHASVFDWPRDLDIPEVMIILHVDDDVRIARIHKRGEVNSHNPWDNRLSSDVDLGKRIMQAIIRMSGPRETLHVEANQSKEELLRKCHALVEERVIRKFAPARFFKADPLQLLRWISSDIGLCDQGTGLRQEQKLWNYTVSVRSTDSKQTLERNHDIDCVDDSGILSFSVNLSGDLKQAYSNALAIATWRQGENQKSCRWQAEGMTSIVSEQERKMIHSSIYRCPTAGVSNIGKQKGGERGLTENSSSKTSESNQELVSMRFVPVQMILEVSEVDCGDNETRYYRWIRDQRNKGSGWADAQQISPLQRPTSFPTVRTIRPVTIAILGTHTAGKQTVGKQVANVLQWKFECELGDVLREKDQLVAGGHRTGDGRGGREAGCNAWDDKVHEAESDRDKAGACCRVVETWHVGNAGWALLRQHATSGAKERQEELLERAKKAIEREIGKSVVLLVHLRVDVETMLRRRKLETSRKRLPMQNEEKECAELHEALDVRGLHLVSEMCEVGIPMVRVDNHEDGKAAIDRAVRVIVEFVGSNMWRRAV